MIEDMQVARTAMINSQLKPSEVNDPDILSAFAAIPREVFVPKSKRGFAYVDEDIEVQQDRYLMEPLILGRLLVASGISSKDVVLDIGCATGYSSAVISCIAEAVVALECDEKMAAKAESLFAELDIMNAATVIGPLEEGKPDQGPFDIIMIQGAVDVIPDALVEQLKDGGRLLCVKRSKGVGRAHIVTRQKQVFAARDLFDANVMPLPGFQKISAFTF